MIKSYTPRQNARTSVKCPFHYSYDGILAKGTIWDLSATGWRATGEVPVPAGSEVAAYFTIPNKGRSQNIAIDAAVVRWSEGLTAGWEITRIEAEARARLIHFLENCNAADKVADTKQPKHRK